MNYYVAIAHKAARELQTTERILAYKVHKYAIDRKILKTEMSA